MRNLLLVAPIVVATVLSAQTPKVAKLTEDLRLDATKEDFPRVSSVLVGPREQIVILVPNEMQFRVYDKTGKKIGAFGRTGSGPGEFRSLFGIGFLADTIWIYDGSLRRFSYWGPDFKLIREHPGAEPKFPGAITPERNLSGIRFAPYLLMPDGSMIGEASVSRSAQAGQPWERFLAVQASSGEVARLPMSPSYEDPRIQLFHAGFYRSMPFTMRPSLAVDYDGSRMGLLTVDNNRPDGGVMSITTWSLANWATARDNEGRMKVELSKRIPFKGEPVPGSVRDSVLAAFIPPPGRQTEGPADLPKRFQDMARERMPSFYNPVESLILGLDKTVWLLRPTRNDRWSADVYDGQGNLLGRVEPPYKTRIRHGTATHVWTTQRDEDDLISIVRYRIDWQK